MSVKKKLMSNVMKNMVSDLAPSDKRDEVHAKVESDLAKKLGDDWMDLPVTGPYMLVLFLVLNYTLLPLGVTPARITDKVLKISRENGLDEKVESLLNGVKSGISKTGEYSSGVWDDVTGYLKELDLGDTIGREIENTKQFLSTGLSKGKSLFGKFLSKDDNDNTDTEM